MIDICPLCGAAMLDDTQDDRDEFWQVTWRCSGCKYFERTSITLDGTVVAVGHEPEEGEG